MKKRVLSLLMALVLCFSMLPAAAMAVDGAAADGASAQTADEALAQAADEALAQAADEEPAQPAEAVLSTENADEAGHPDHKYCGSADCGHDGEGSVEFARPISNAEELQAADAGSYYLTDNVDLSSTWEPKSGTVLCLNGKRLSLTNATGAVIHVAQGRTFTLLDCQGTGTITHRGNAGGQGVLADGRFYMYGGTITRNWGDESRNDYAGGVYVSGTGSFYMYGGAVKNNNFTSINPNTPHIAGVLVATGGGITLSRDADISDNGTSSDIYLCNNVKIAIGADGLSGSHRFYVRLQYRPAYRSGETVEITYPTDTDVSANIRSSETDCTTNDRPRDHVVLLTARLASNTTGLTFTMTPETLTLTEGASGTLATNTSTSTAHRRAYQWYRNTQDSIYGGGTAIDGETGWTFNVPNTLTPGTYYYYCTVSLYNDDGGIVQQENAKAVVKVLGTLTIRKGADVTQPYGTEGGKVTLDMSGTEGYTLSYQWYEADPEDTAKDRLISGATGAEYPIPKDTPVGEYEYYCVAKAQELSEQFKTSPSKVTITKGTVASDNFVVKSIAVYFNTATTYTYDLKDALPEGVVLSNASYTIDGDYPYDPNWIDGSAQLSGSVLTFNSKAASAADDDDADILRLTITVTSDNYETFYILLTGKATPKWVERLTMRDLRWTYGAEGAPKQPDLSGTNFFPEGVTLDQMTVTYKTKRGEVFTPTRETPAGEYDFTIEYETVSTRYIATGTLKIDPILVDKDWIYIQNTRTTYDGTTKNVEEFIEVTVEVNGKKITLSPNDFYVGGVTAAASASATPKKATFKLQGNYAITTGEVKEFEWFIDPLEVKLALENGTDRKYGDGKGNVTLKAANAPEFDTVTVACTGGDDLSVGSHTITATALLKADGTTNTNYKLPDNGTLTYTIAKGDAPARKELTMDVYNNTAKTYTYDFTKALPDGLTLGTVSYEGRTSSYSSKWIDPANIRFVNGVLTFPAKRASDPSALSLLLYTVTVKSENYQDFELCLVVHPKDKPQTTVPESDITMDGWTYGQTPTTPSVANLPAGVTPTFTYKDANGTEITPAYTTDAGEYTLTVRAETDDAVYTGTKTFTVAPKVLTAEDIPEFGGAGYASKIYDGSTYASLHGTSIKPSAYVGTDNGLCVYGKTRYDSANVAEASKLIFTANGTIDNSFDQSGRTNANNYTIASGTSWEYPARIAPRPIAFTVDSVSKTYGSADSAAAVKVVFCAVGSEADTGLVDGEQLVQGVDYDVTAAFSRATVGQDDNVTVTVTLKDTPAARNYKLASAAQTGVTGTITKAAAPVIPEQTVEIYSNAATRYAIDLTKDWPAGTPTILDYDYDRNSPYFDAQEITQLLYQNASYVTPAPDEWAGTIWMNTKAFDADVGTDLGVLKITFKSANYEDVTIPIRVKVKAKAQEPLPVSLEGWTYGEAANPPSYTVPIGAVKTTLTYTSRDGQTSCGAVPPTTAGDYILTVRCEGIDTVWTGSTDFTIAKKQITPPAADTTGFTYTAAEQTYTLPANEAYTISPNTTQTNAGGYTITVSLNDADNTQWADGTTAAKAYTFTIAPAKLTVTALDKKIMAGQPVPDLTAPVPGEDYTVDGLLGQDALTAVTLTYGETPDTGKTGSYAIHISAVQENYDITTVPGTLTVTRRPSSGSSITYPVDTPGKTENGTVTVSPKSASQGSTVTITVTPDSGYVLETVAATDQNGSDLKLTDKGDGKYSFTMPAGKVDVKAAFMEDNSLLNFFYDVPNDAYYYEAVKWAQEKGITGGIGNDLFGPDRPCTRGQIVTFLWRAAGSPEPKSMGSFTDVPADSYYAKAVAWAVENGITVGTSSTTFSPDAACTRAQAVTFLWRSQKAPDAAAANPFADVKSAAYYTDAVLWAVEKRITSGTSAARFSPGADCTRAQIVTFLYRMYQGG